MDTAVEAGVEAIPTATLPVKPLGDQVFVLPLAEPERFEKFTGLLWIQNVRRRERGRAHRDFVYIGRVVAVGPGDKWRYRKPDSQSNQRCYGPPEGVSRWPVEVKPGDVVLYCRRGDETNVFVGHQEYLVLYEEQHVLAVLEGYNDHL